MAARAVTAIYHPGKNRIYVRRFDHDDARRRFAAGERISDLAAEYSVTVNAVDRIVHNRQAKQLATCKKWRTGVCEECGGYAMRLVHGKKAHNPDGRVLCATCRGCRKCLTAAKTKPLECLSCSRRRVVSESRAARREAVPTREGTGSCVA